MKQLDAPAPLGERLSGDVNEADAFAAHLAHIQRLHPQRVAADPSNVEQGLAKLVLTLIELIRQLLEKQAIRRMDSGTLTEDQIERMGETFLKLEEKLAELKEAFGLEHEDLNLHLGPLGDLL